MVYTGELRSFNKQKFYIYLVGMNQREPGTMDQAFFNKIEIDRTNNSSVRNVVCQLPLQVCNLKNYVGYIGSYHAKNAKHVVLLDFELVYEVTVRTTQCRKSTLATHTADFTL